MLNDPQAVIREHFDAMLDVYEELWGEHIHHGYWDVGAPARDRHAAQLRTVHELIAFGEVPPGARVLDVGCGVGAASVVLARELGCRVEGITLSPAQVARAREKAAAAGLSGSLHFQVADALAAPFPAASFDVAWALESCELMPDKDAFLRECARVLRPGGRLVVATWCRAGGHLAPDALDLLRAIYREFSAAYVLPLAEYAHRCRALGLVDVRVADWTEHTRRTWDLGLARVAPLLRHPGRAWALLRRRGPVVYRFLRSLPLMKQAYDRGVMRYGVFRATTPPRPDGGP